MENHPHLDFEKNIENRDFRIPPMILQPIIENCFKHSRLETNPNGYVKLAISQNGQNLVFTAENSQSPCVFAQQQERSGIGVSNLEKRLELAYGKNCSMKVENNSQFYRVEIRIKEK